VKQDTKRLRGKASELRHLGRALLHAFRAVLALDLAGWTNEQRDLHQLILTGIELNIELDVILDENSGWRIHGLAYRQLVQKAHDFACLYNELARRTAAMEHELFQITIKLHHLLHLARSSCHMHPKATWCFAGETFMKICKKLMATCTRSHTPWEATGKFCQKYRYALHYLFTGLCEDNEVVVDDLY
jgi:hypothetical protein